MNGRAFILAVTLIGASCVSDHALQPPLAMAADSDEDKAVKLFLEGQKLFDKGDFAGALPVFEKVDALLASPNARLYIARCLAKLDRLPEAFEAMDATVALATDKAADDDSYIRTRDAAAAEREALATKIGRIVVAVADVPEGLSIRVNDRDIDGSLIGKQVGVAPGKVEVVASAPGHEELRREIEVSRGDVQTLAIALRPVQASEDDDKSDEPEGEETNPLLIVGAASLGIGVAGMVVFAVAGVMANNRFAQIEDECGEPPCTDPKYTDLIEEGKTMDAAANVGVGIGAVGIAAGALMVILALAGDSGEAEEGDAARASIDIGLEPEGAFVGYRIRF